VLSSCDARRHTLSEVQVQCARLGVCAVRHRATPCVRVYHRKSDRLEQRWQASKGEPLMLERCAARERRAQQFFCAARMMRCCRRSVRVPGAARWRAEVGDAIRGEAGAMSGSLRGCANTERVRVREQARRRKRVPAIEDADKRQTIDR